MNPSSETNPLSSLDESFGGLLHLVRVGLIRHLELAFAEAGFELNFSQFRVLKTLSIRGPIISSELARCVDHDAGAMTRLLDRLVDKGYVTRRPREDDRRATDIDLSEAGRVLWTSIARIVEQVNARALRDLDAEEQAQIFALLRRVRASLDPL